MQIFIEYKNVINVEMQDNTLFFTWQNKILKGCLYVIQHNSIKTSNGIFWVWLNAEGKYYT